MSKPAMTDLNETDVELIARLRAYADKLDAIDRAVIKRENPMDTVLAFRAAADRLEVLSRPHEPLRDDRFAGEPTKYRGYLQPGYAPEYYGPDDVVVDGDWLAELEKLNAELAGSATIVSREELEALPVGSIVVSASGRVAARWDAVKFTQFGDDRAFEPWSQLSLPARLLLVGNGTHEVGL